MPSSQDIKRALARIRSVLPREKKVEAARRQIRLGLERVSRIVPDRQEWIGIHVAGTNGKGSICTLLAGMMRRAGISHGLFLSPAMPEPHHGVLINGRYVNRRMYELELQDIEAAYRRASVGWTFSTGEDPGPLTPFERETAAAFRVFDNMHVKYGIVEVGMGGATDATNVMKEKAVTVISRIDLDHQEYLGRTVEEIAKVKAGIMRRGVPCIVDHSNDESVLDVLQLHALKVGARIVLSSKAAYLLDELDREQFKLERYEEQNLLCAALAFQSLFPSLQLDVNKLVPTQARLLGRKELVKVCGLTDGLRQAPILVDGAHNMLGVEALAGHVQGEVRQQQDEPVTWVIALSFSDSKPFDRMIEALLRPQDRVAFVEYTPRPNDPAPVPAELGRDMARAVLQDDSQLYDGEPSVGAAVQWACAKAGEGPVVVTGSLYMIRELYGLDGVEQQWKIGSMRPGRSQLWHYTRLAQERRLTDEEEREFKRARRHWHLSPERSPVFRHVRDGGRPMSDEVPEWVRDLQRTAAHHKNQADGYGAAIASIKNDMNAASATDDTGLGDNIRDLQSKKEEHLRAYSKAMFHMRGRVSNPAKKYLSYEQVFGRRPKLTGGRIEALMLKHGLQEEQAMLSEAEAAGQPGSGAPAATEEAGPWHEPWPSSAGGDPARQGR